MSRQKIPKEALAAVVVDVNTLVQPRLMWQAQAAMNPASVMKLVTTFAALDVLGPAFVWRTPVYVDGAIHKGRLKGHVYIKGQGDPQLVVEQIWLLLLRLQALGIRQIDGDIVLDRSAFALDEIDPGEFDGEPLRAYNVQPDALLLNYKSVLLNIAPDASKQQVRVQVVPALAGVDWSMQLSMDRGACGDWRSKLKLNLQSPSQPRLSGSIAESCGEKQWPLAYWEPQTYAARLLTAMWHNMGGELRGRVREGKVPADLKPRFEWTSPSLAEVVRDINKYSNNVMAQQLFLTLGLQAQTPATRLASAQWLLQWWRRRLPGVAPPVLHNGSGLSRQEQATAMALSRLLQLAWSSHVMPEFLASLPVVGVDGTLRQQKSVASGWARLKSGHLSQVAARAGYVQTADGQRCVLVAMINHPNAAEAAPVWEALLEWTFQGSGRDRSP